MSRKSSSSLVTLSFCHVTPPSTVRNTVELAPHAHATRSLTALTPRNRAVTPLDCTVQCGAASIKAVSTAIFNPHLQICAWIIVGVALRGHPIRASVCRGWGGHGGPPLQRPE